jgi:hypothetical protein
MNTEVAATVWWSRLTDGERQLWRDEAGSNDPVACFTLYWSRGPMLDEKTLADLTSGRCPRCHYRGFVIGPQGGSAINIECGNVECRERYNVVFYSGAAIIGHAIGNGATSSTWPSEPDKDALSCRDCGKEIVEPAVLCAECQEREDIARASE